MLITLISSSSFTSSSTLPLSFIHSSLVVLYFKSFLSSQLYSQFTLWLEAPCKFAPWAQHAVKIKRQLPSFSSCSTYFFSSFFIFFSSSSSSFSYTFPSSYPSLSYTSSPLLRHILPYKRVICQVYCIYSQFAISASLSDIRMTQAVRFLRKILIDIAIYMT